MQFKHFVGAFVIAAPFLVLVGDAVIWRFAGPDSTITHIVRGWDDGSPMLKWIVGCLFFILWLHLFPSAWYRPPLPKGTLNEMMVRAEAPSPEAGVLVHVRGDYLGGQP